MIVVSIAIRLFIVLSRRSDQRLYSHDRGDRRRSLSPRRRSAWPLAPACPWARSPPSVSIYVLSEVLAARELVRHALASIEEPLRFEQRADPPAHGSLPDAVQRERERDVLRHGQVR